jgi:hypothetical protein
VTYLTDAEYAAEVAARRARLATGSGTR